MQSLREVSCRADACRAVPCRAIPCHVTSCRVMSCRAVPCRIMTCHVRRQTDSLAGRREARSVDSRQANASERKPTLVNASQSKPTQANANQRTPTQTNARQRTPTRMNPKRLLGMQRYACRRAVAAAWRLRDPPRSTVPSPRGEGKSGKACTGSRHPRQRPYSLTHLLTYRARHAEDLVILGKDLEAEGTGVDVVGGEARHALRL